MANRGSKPNGGAVIRLGKPRPVLPDGIYRAICTDADWAWTKRFKRNQVKFAFDTPLDYTGAKYAGELCAFCALGGEEGEPYASPGGKFYALWTQANGGAPTLPALTKSALKEMFETRLFEVEVETVKGSWKRANKDDEDLPPELWYSVVRKFRLAPLPSQPGQPSQPGNHDNHPNHLTFQPVNKPHNQATSTTSQPTRFPNGDSALILGGDSHRQQHYPGGADEITVDSVPRSLEPKEFPQPPADRLEMLRHQAATLVRSRDTSTRSAELCSSLVQQTRAPEHDE